MVSRYMCNDGLRLYATMRVLLSGVHTDEENIYTAPENGLRELVRPPYYPGSFL